MEISEIKLEKITSHKKAGGRPLSEVKVSA
jgi:hypothetical protein